MTYGTGAIFQHSSKMFKTLGSLVGLQLVCTLYSLIMKYNTLSFPIPLLLITYVSGEDVSVLLTLQALT